MLKKIIVTGSDGRFAQELKKIKSKYNFIFTNKKKLNILSLKSINKCFKNFNPDGVSYLYYDFGQIILLALGVLLLSLITAVLLSKKRASDKGEHIWNSTSKRLLASMMVPLTIGGVLILFYLSNDLYGLIAPTSLIFYGLSLYNAGNFTINEVRWMGFLQIASGLMNVWFLEFGLLFWAIGFGVIHLVYGIYMHFRYER